MANVQENVNSFPIGLGPISASAKNAQKAEVWAEGTDAQVSELGGTHSAKGWATSAAGYASDPNIVACGTNISSINTVASNIPDVSSVAGISGSVSTVSGISEDVTTVAGKKDDISTCATNIADISAAPTSASDAAASAVSANNSATNAQKWAEGADSAVTPMGGTHSAKGWAEQAQSIVSSLGTVLHYKGSVANYAALQAVTGQVVGDVYNVTDTGDNYAWDGSAWDKLSGTVDLSAYRTASAQDVIDAGKQPLLPAGTTGYYLQKTANGVQWAAVDALPSQSGNSGKFLTTDGTTASWEEVSAPANVWTSDNLKAGNNITITEIQKPVIDENTIALVHFDDNDTDVITGLSTNLGTGSGTYINGHFGKCLASDYDRYVNSADALKTQFTRLQDFTYDFWVKCWDTSAKACCVFTNWMVGGAGLTLCPSNFGNDSNKLIFDGITTVSVPSGTFDTWAHVAIVHSVDTAKIYIFVNGKKLYEGSDAGSYSSAFELRSITYRGYFDEFRLSNVARWTEDFTPFTGPYTEAGGNAEYQINAIIPQSSSAPTLTWYTGNTGTTVTIADTSSANLVKVYKNGILLQPTADYSISGTTLTLVTALESTDKITVEQF